MHISKIVFLILAHIYILLKHFYDDFQNFFLFTFHRPLKMKQNDDNNNSMRKLPPIRNSNSSGNLIDRQYYIEGNDSVRDKKVKRTKSFWKFGKNHSDNEILEGMALWKHRDLVDVDENKKITTLERIMNEKNKAIGKKISRDRSNDSDKTLNAKQYEENGVLSRKVEERSRHMSTFGGKKKTALPPRKISEMRDDDFEDKFDVVRREDQFYDDGDDGLMLKTVNRKNILQQYTNDSTGPDSETESDVTSDDPYDCIVVDDQAQKVKKNGEHFPNVAAIGKKLEKLSKSSKYAPHGGEIHDNFARGNSEKNGDGRHSVETNGIGRRSSMRHSIEKNGDIRHSVENNSVTRHSMEKNGPSRHSADKNGINREAHFRDGRNTFKQNSENGEKEAKENEYYTRNIKRNESDDNRRYCGDSNDRKIERRTKKVYETAESEIERSETRNNGMNRRNNVEKERKGKLKYYSERHQESTADEFEESPERQYLPRTKLNKTNSNSSAKYDSEVALTDYGETLQRRLKSREIDTKFNDKSPLSGNMYGPWYDLWGLDASVRK